MIDTYTQKRNQWQTPHPLFDYLNEIHRFKADMTASSDDSLCSIYYRDSLEIDWPFGWLWCNPPFSRCKEFVRKAIHENVRDKRIKTLLVLPGNRTDQDWWHDLVEYGARVHYLRGRVNYVPPPGIKASSPSFASVLISVGEPALLPPTIRDWPR